MCNGWGSRRNQSENEYENSLKNFNKNCKNTEIFHETFHEQKTCFLTSLNTIPPPDDQHACLANSTIKLLLQCSVLAWKALLSRTLKLMPTLALFRLYWTSQEDAAVWPLLLTTLTY